MSLKAVLDKAKSDSKLKVDVDTIVDKNQKIEVISTGSLIVDKLIGRGGVGRGRITELYGLESSGKTSLALHIAKEAQRRKLNVAFVDFECALDRVYAKEGIGVNLSEDKFAHLQPQCLEEGCDLIDYLLSNHKETNLGVIIIDSVKAMTPKAILEGMMTAEPPMALQARKIGNFLSKLVKRIKDTNTAVILLNQMIKNIKTNPFQGGGEHETPGGLSVRFYASTRIQLRKRTTEMVEGRNEITWAQDKIPDTNVIEVSITKNKIGSPYKKADIYMKFGKGIDNKRSIIEMAKNKKIIVKAGTWFSYKEGEEDGFKVQGEAALREHIMAPENKPLLIELANKLEKVELEKDTEVEKQAKELETKDQEALAKKSKKKTK